MTAEEVLEKLRVLDVSLEVAGDKLRLSPPEAISPDLLEAIRAHKPELLALLSRETSKTDLSELSEPSRWARLADSGLHHNDVQAHNEVVFLFAHELILDPSRAKEDCQTLPTLWSYYSPFWQQDLPQEAFAELERRYRRRLAALGLTEETGHPQAPKPLRPLVLNAEGTGCKDCGSPEYWVSKGGARFCLECHPAFYRDAIAIGKLVHEEPKRARRGRKIG